MNAQVAPDAQELIIEAAERLLATDGPQKATVRAITQAAGVNVEVNRSTERNPAQVIRREAAARKPRYVVKGTHYHTPSERAKLTYEDWELIRDLEYPLWIVKPGEWREPSVVVAAVDPVHAHDKPAHLDRRIIKQAREVAEFTDGKLKVVHCYQTLE